MKYVCRLISKLLPISGVVTKITLDKATSKGGQPYAQYNFEVAETLSPDEVNKIRVYGNSIMNALTETQETQELEKVV